MWNIFNKKDPDFFTDEEQSLIVDAIKEAESRTSGEIRLFVEGRCKFVNAMDRALEVFEQLQMYHTEARNGVLVYLAMKDKQLAIFGDAGIHAKVGDTFWQQEIKQILQQFDRKNFAAGIEQMIIEIGDALKDAFPYDRVSDENELPDNIVYGK